MLYQKSDGLRRRYCRRTFRANVGEVSNKVYFSSAIGDGGRISRRVGRSATSDTNSDGCATGAAEVNPKPPKPTRGTQGSVTAATTNADASRRAGGSGRQAFSPSGADPITTTPRIPTPTNGIAQETSNGPVCRQSPTE